MILIRKHNKYEIYGRTWYDYMCNDDDVPIEFADVDEARKYIKSLGYTDADIFDNDIEFYECKEPINWQAFDDCTIRNLLG